MKLTISRTTGRRGFFKSVTVFRLNVHVDATPWEMVLLEKAGRNSNGWEYNFGTLSVLVWTLHGDSGKQLTARHFVGRTTSWDVETAPQLEIIERQLVLLMKAVQRFIEALAMQERQQIEAAQHVEQQNADFAPRGPHEVEL
jgi:hypothetical protein